MSENRPKSSDALRYHEFPTPGKIEVVPSKPCQTQRDLSLAYTPGVAEPCLEIARDPDAAYKYTAKGNLVAVITDGTAVLGLGNIGALAGKPVMEGKGVLFKRFAGIDVFDLELDTSDNEAFISAVKALAPTFGGINLEDIASPNCFEIEQRLSAELDIPVFHDDQHGTAIIVCAALLNALELQDKAIGDIRMVVSGAGAAAVAIAKLAFSLGVDPKKSLMTDSRGVLYPGRAGVTGHKLEFARDTEKRSLEDALTDADVFVGVSVANTVSPEMLKKMAPRPIVMALANPDPEIPYPDAIASRQDLVMATGRSDFPNQVNNVLGFPFLFRGALDVRATGINEAMKHAAVQALAELAREPVPDTVARAYGVKSLSFGPEYIIPKPLDARVLRYVAPAVAKAAVESGAARKHIEDWEAYDNYLARLQGPTYAVLEPLRASVRTAQPRMVFPEGNDPKLIRAAARLVEERSGQPILLGDPKLIHATADALSVDLDGIKLIDIGSCERRNDYAESLWKLRARKGVTLDSAKVLAQNPFYYSAVMLREGDADAVISGVTVQYPDATRPALQVLGTTGDVLCGIYALAFRERLLFFADCTIHVEPSAEELAGIAHQAARVAQAFGVKPSVGMLSFSSFGSVQHPKATRIARAVQLVKESGADFPIDGELQANVALNTSLREELFPFCELEGDPNVLIFPDLQSSNIAYNLLSTIGGATAIGPILVGVDGAFSALRMGASVDDIVNVAVVTAALDLRDIR